MNHDSDNERLYNSETGKIIESKSSFCSGETSLHNIQNRQNRQKL